MKYLSALLLIISIPAHAGWTTGEKVAEVTYLTLHTADWLQTRFIAKHPQTYYESFNTVLGSHPSVGKVNLWFASTALLQPLIADALPHSWRKLWIGTGIGMEFILTTHNAQIGIRMEIQ